MNSENIIREIYRHREELARQCGYDVKKLMNHYRGRESEREAKGHQLVSFVEPANTTENSCALHDKPPTKNK